MTAYSVRFAEGGRLVVPAKLRKELGVEIGDTVFMRVTHGHLEVWSQKQAISRVQERVRELTGGKRSLVDELLAERRAEAAHEALGSTIQMTADDQESGETGGSAAATDEGRGA